MGYSHYWSHCTELMTFQFSKGSLQHISGHANDTTNFMMAHKHGSRVKHYQLIRNGFNGRTYEGMYNFEEASEIIIRYELPLREAHHSACMKFGELNAQHLPFNPALITEWHGNVPSRSRMFISECMQPWTGQSRRTEAEAAVYSGTESPFAKCEDPRARRLIDARILPFMIAMIEDGLVGEALLDLDTENEIHMDRLEGVLARAKLPAVFVADFKLMLSFSAFIEDVGGAGGASTSPTSTLELELKPRPSIEGAYSGNDQHSTRANSAIVRVAEKGRTSCVKLKLTFNLNLEPEPVVGNNKVRHRPTHLDCLGDQLQRPNRVCRRRARAPSEHPSTHLRRGWEASPSPRPPLPVAACSTAPS